MRFFLVLLTGLCCSPFLWGQTPPARVEVSLHGKAVKDLPVEFLRFGPGGDPLGVMRAQTNAKGVAQVQLPPEDESFAVRAVYQNVSYFSDILPANYPSAIQLIVYPSTQEAGRIKIEDLRIFAEPVEEGLLIRQEFVLNNEESSTFVGKGSGETAETFRFSLPNSAFELERGMGIGEESTRFENNDVIINTPLVPGQTRLSLSYKLEKKRGAVNFTQKFSFPLEQLSLGVSDPSIRPSFAETVAALPKFFDGQMMLTYQVLNAEKPPKELSFKITGLPLSIRFSQWLPFVVLVLLLLPLLLSRSTKTSSLLSPEERARLIEELRNLDRLKSQKLIEDSEYQLRRLLALEKLWPHEDGSRT